MYSYVLLCAEWIALVALILVSWGLVDQLRKIRTPPQSTAALDPYRYGGIAVANLLWALWAFSAPEWDLPLGVGCGLQVVLGGVLAWHFIELPPEKTKLQIQWQVFVIVSGIAGLLLLAVQREVLYPCRNWLETASFIVSALAIHIFTVKQWMVTKEQGIGKSVGGEIWKIFLNWAFFLPYPLLLIAEPLFVETETSIWEAFGVYWAMLLNTVVGFVTSLMRVVQFHRLK